MRAAGHVWRMNALLKAQLDQAERGIWQALHALEDHAASPPCWQTVRLSATMRPEPSRCSIRQRPYTSISPSCSGCLPGSFSFAKVPSVTGHNARLARTVELVHRRFFMRL
jgi:hypothetical protein